jgi:hypothetical protein
MVGRHASSRMTMATCTYLLPDACDEAANKQAALIALALDVPNENANL